MTVSAEVFEIKSLKAFQQWLAEHRQSAVQRHAGRHPCRTKCLLLSANRSFEFQWDSYVSQQRYLQPISLPAIAEAREWWFQFWEGEIVTCHFLPDLKLIVLAKQAVWLALPAAYMDWPKEYFREIDLKNAKRVLEPSEFSTMHAEVQCCGIATRILRSQRDDLPQLLNFQ